jgi:hypothetical protein
MVSNPIQLPQFPGSSPDQLTRKQGAHYAQRVLRIIDGLEGLQSRLEGLQWSIEEMTRVRDSIVGTLKHGSDGATFFEGVLGGLTAARNVVERHASTMRSNLETAAGCREKAARLISYAEKLERSADAPITLADARFK